MRQMRETLSALFKRYIVEKKAMFIPFFSVATFMLVGYAAIDREAPVIFSDSIDLSYGDKIDSDVIDIADNRDARNLLTVDVNTKSLDVKQLGKYKVEVTATDLFNNQSTKDITVNVVDQVGPEFEVQGSDKGYVIQVPIQGSPEIGNYVKAIDDVDGDVTPFMETSATLDTSKIGFQTITLTATDSSGNISEQTYEFAVTDLTPPEIILKQGTTATIDYGCDFSLDMIAEVRDSYDASLQVKIEGTVDTKLENEVQTVKIIATDAAGNMTEATVDCIVKDISAPVITLSNDSIKCQKGEAIDGRAYLVSAIDNKDGDVSANVNISSIDTSMSGQKEITYTVSDASGNMATASLLVTIGDGGNEALVNAALAQVGVHQDCTMLVTNALRAIGIYHHGWPISYMSLGHVVPASEALPGDIIYYADGGLGMAHVALYIGNGKAVHGGWTGGTTVVYKAHYSTCTTPVYIRVDR